VSRGSGAKSPALTVKKFVGWSGCNVAEADDFLTQTGSVQGARLEVFEVFVRFNRNFGVGSCNVSGNNRGTSFSQAAVGYGRNVGVVGGDEVGQSMDAKTQAASGGFFQKNW